VQEAGGEGFVGRWSRLKADARDRALEKPNTSPTPADPQAPPPDLPSLENLTFDSDYRQFFHPKVGEDVRRAALKQLFTDPHFNVMDGLDVYIDDYSKTEPIPAAMLAGLKQAQNIFRWAKEDAEERRKAGDGVENEAREAEMGEPPESLEASTEAPDVPDARVGEPIPATTSDTDSKGRS